MLYLIEQTQLSTDALLNIIYSSSLALALIALTFIKSYQGNNLSIVWRYSVLEKRTLLLSILLLLVCAVFLGLTLRTPDVVDAA